MILPEMEFELTRLKMIEIEKAIDYILKVAALQGYLIDAGTLYGDGTKWKILSRTGFNMVWESVQQTLKDRGSI